MRPLSMQFTARCTALEISRSWSCLGLVLPPPALPPHSRRWRRHSTPLIYLSTIRRGLNHWTKGKENWRPPNRMIYIYIYVESVENRSEINPPPLECILERRGERANKCIFNACANIFS